jgi:hypothetical protein
MLLSIGVHHERQTCGEALLGIDDLHTVEIAIERCLVGGTGIEGELDACSVPCGIVVEVEVGAFVEAMQEGSWTRGSEVGVDVGVPG